MIVTKEITLKIELTNKDLQNLISGLGKVIGIAEVSVNRDYLDTAEQKLFEAIYKEVKSH